MLIVSPKILTRSQFTIPFQVEMQLTFCSIFRPLRSYFQNILRLLGFLQEIEFDLRTTS